MVSQHTQERLEGYFRHEWNLAIERTHQEGREPLFLGRGVDGGTDEMAGRRRDAPVPQQGRQAAPAELVARLPVHPIATAQPWCAYSMT